MFGEQRYHKCEVGIYDFNHASLALHHRLGFTEEGRLRDHEFFAGRPPRHHHDGHDRRRISGVTVTHNCEVIATVHRVMVCGRAVTLGSWVGGAIDGTANP